ncbi:hypothetical protein N9L68_04120 [bacterium]|nr:hypothetical protein [bacterium]
MPGPLEASPPTYSSTSVSTATCSRYTARQEIHTGPGLVDEATDYCTLAFLDRHEWHLLLGRLPAMLAWIGRPAGPLRIGQRARADFTQLPSAAAAQRDDLRTDGAEGTLAEEEGREEYPAR